ncbi:MAG: hypothetical protein VX033_03260, partial [Verrucomicrobiota bacterium]|nr:hypothetical protein [Verrucomicrobiota bacterium]
LETVTAIGYGEDVNGATQNAVESALTQVVGSFIDADKFIKQKTEIQNAVSKTSKTISSSFSSYSQGSVESLEILDVADNGSMKKVTASVTIRIEDFKRYIREVALGEAKIKGGLFAKAKVKQSQGVNLAELVVDKILSPARNYEAVDVKIGEVSLVEDIGIEEAATNAKLNLDNKTLVRVPVTVQIKQDFLENAYKILDETSVDRYKGGQIKGIKIREKGYDHSDNFFLLLFADHVTDRSINSETIFGSSGNYQGPYSLFSRAGLSSEGYINPEQARLYALPKSHLNALVKRMQVAKLATGTPGCMYANNSSVATVNLRILNSMGDLIFEDYITEDGYSVVKSSSSLIIGEGAKSRRGVNSKIAAESLTVLFSKLQPGWFDSRSNNISYPSPPRNFVALIDMVKNFEIIAALSDDVLEAANSIEVEISY